MQRVYSKVGHGDITEAEQHKFRSLAGEGTKSVPFMDER